MRFFQCIALPFGWSRSGHWFVRVVSRFWTYVNRTLRYRVLSYIDDFCICPSLGRILIEEDYVKADRVLDSLRYRYGLTRHPTVLARALPGREGNYVYVGKLLGTRMRRQFSVRTMFPPILSPGPRDETDRNVYRFPSKRGQLSVQRVAPRNRRSQFRIERRDF
jgi:hypothetical protein